MAAKKGTGCELVTRVSHAPSLTDASPDESLNSSCARADSKMITAISSDDSAFDSTEYRGSPGSWPGYAEGGTATRKRRPNRLTTFPSAPERFRVGSEVVDEFPVLL